MRPPLIPQLVLSIFGTAAVLLTHAASLPVFWEREFEQATAGRNRFCASVGLGEPAGEYGLRSPAQWQSLGERLVSYENPGSPWLAFFSGVALTKTSGGGPGGTSDPYAATYFDKALSLCAQHPGLCGVLASEFRRFGFTEWEEKALKNLEKLFLACGAQSAPIVSQQLLWCASRAEGGGLKDEAFRYLEWAAAFERHPVWPLLRTAWTAFPENIDKMTTAIDELTTIVKESWTVQMALARTIEGWLSAALSILVAAILLALGLKYVPRALHRLTHPFSRNVTLHVRQGFAAGIYVSLIFFGVIPFLWLTALLIWRHLSTREKIIGGVCLVFLAFAPLRTRLHDMLTQPSRADNSLFLFEKALNEGYYAELNAALRARTQAHPDDFLAHLGCAVMALKNCDSVAALSSIRTAESLRPSDPVVLLTAANIFQFTKDLARADQYFTKCISTFPELEASYFNPTLSYFDERRFVEGINLIKNASKINPRIVGTFTRKNDDYFAGAWPPLRQFLQPDYRSDYFFRSVLPEFSGTWESSDEAWGTAFLGLPLLPSLAVSGILLLAVFGRGTLRSRSPDDFLCRLCGIPMCRSCKRGDMCIDCHMRAGDIHDAEVVQKVRQAILVRHQLQMRLAPRVTDIVFPGLGTLTFSDSFSVTGLLYTVLTAVLFGAYARIAPASLSVPIWMAGGMGLPVIVAGACYQAVFLVRNTAAIAKILRAK